MADNDNLQWMPLEVAQAMTEEESADFSIYLSNHADHCPVLYREAGQPDLSPDFARLNDAGISHILVKGDELGQCEKTLEDNLCNVLNDENIEPARKAACVQHVGTSVVRDLMDTQEGPKDLDRASKILDNIIEGVLADPIVSANLLEMSAHHRTTASHMFSVSTLAVLLGSEVFGTDLQKLKELGLAGMLHDLGKINISPEVLNKETPLCPQEMLLIRHHPIESVRLIGQDPAATMTVRQMILQHHERPDGKGYPLGIRSNELEIGSRILAIVDSFHALIGRRSYNGQLSPTDANRILKFQVGRQFDPDLYALWEGLLTRCWKIHPNHPITDEIETDVGASFHSDHRRTNPQAISRMMQRSICRGTVKIKCVYAGRLINVNPAPNVFASPLYDLSRAGLCMCAPDPMYRGEIVNILIDSGMRKDWLRCLVRWCRRQEKGSGYKIGLQFSKRISANEVGQRVEPLGMDEPNLFPELSLAVA